MSSGFCKQYDWCPTPNHNDSSFTKTYIMEDLDKLYFEFISVVQFGTEEERADIIYSTNIVEVDESGNS